MVDLFGLISSFLEINDAFWFVDHFDGGRFNVNCLVVNYAFGWLIVLEGMLSWLVDIFGGELF